MESALKVRGLPSDDIPCASGDLTVLDLDDWAARTIIEPVLTILQFGVNEPLAKEAFSKVAARLAEWWMEDTRSVNRRGNRRDYHLENTLEGLLANFVCRLAPGDAEGICGAVVALVNRRPKEVGEFIEKLTVAADGGDAPVTFWALWSRFSKEALQSSWLSDIDQPRYSRDDGFLAAMFLGISWKEGVRHWPKLEGYSQLLDGFFDELPPSRTAVSAYVRFLFKVGEQSLPGAFVHIANKLRENNATDLLSGTNTLFYLESLLRYWVYGRPDTLKRDNDLKEAVLELLDALVGAGSSAAYRMRDDFVTPSQ